MSTSKWRWTEECDHGICVGDCDKCDKAVFEDTVQIYQTNATKALGAIIEGENNDEIEKRNDGDRFHFVSDFRKRLG